jgi:hypothetical protein
MTVKAKKDMDALKNESQLQRGKVIDFILDNVLDVDLTIPDVVKGRFAEKMKIGK